MKAIVFERLGGPEVLEYRSVPDPVARAGEVVVDIVAASVNGADWKVRSGKSLVQAKFPHISGRDFSGVVSAVGEGVADVRVGDPVFAVCDEGHEGAYAEKIAIRAAIVAAKPEALSHPEAAAVALTGITAVSALEDTLALKAGETILVQGGAGGVGTIAAQLAKHLGAYVVATAGPANRDYLLSLGADKVVDYTAGDFRRETPPCDAVLDTVGGEVASRSIDVLKPGGRAAFIASGAKPPESGRRDVSLLRPKVGRSRACLERLASLLAGGVLCRPEITLFPLRDAASAQRLSESRHFRGKIVLQVR